jgi:MoaA/NifB/PqqE/SkfB family radical SAM enzyme
MNLNLLKIYPTFACNMKCLNCSTLDKSTNLISIDTILPMLLTLKPKYIYIFGGEPFFNIQHLNIFVQEIVRHKHIIQYQSLQCTTNGYWIKDELYTLPEMQNIFSNLNWLSIRYKFNNLSEEDINKFKIYMSNKTYPMLYQMTQHRIHLITKLIPYQKKNERCINLKEYPSFNSKNKRLYICGFAHFAYLDPNYQLIQHLSEDDYSVDYAIPSFLKEWCLLKPKICNYCYYTNYNINLINNQINLDLIDPEYMQKYYVRV